MTAIWRPAGQPSVRERSRRLSMGSRPRPASSSSCSTSTWVNARSSARSSVITPASRSRDVENTGLCWLATSRRTWAGMRWATLASVRCGASANWASSMTTAAAGSSARSRASASTSSGSSHEGRSTISAASLPMAGHRAARLEVSRNQNRAGSPSDLSQDSQATCTSVVMAHSASRLVLPKPEGATRSISGSAAVSSLRSRAARCSLGPVARGTAICWLWTDMLFSVWMVSPPWATWVAAPCPARRRRVHPAVGDPWVMPGRHPADESGRERHAREGR